MPKRLESSYKTRRRRTEVEARAALDDLTRSRLTEQAFSSREGLDLQAIAVPDEDADDVLLLHQPSIATDTAEPREVLPAMQPWIVEVIVAKQSVGTTGTAHLYWTPGCTRFDDIGDVERDAG